ncbi:MAG: hypothetical protein WAU42_14275 [Solirubrobacteraceae bacterium]
MRNSIKAIGLVFLAFSTFGATSAYAAKWELEKAVLPTGGTEGYLRAVSCFSSTNCTSVGSYSNGSIGGAFGNEWNGTAWSVTSVIANPGTKNGDLRGISCFSATTCRAVGTYGTEEGGKGVGKSLVESVKEKVWKTIPSPNSSLGKNAEFMGVSCPGEGGFCLATGQYLRTSGEETGAAFASEWNGEEWALLSPIENPGNRKNGQLLGVSCIEAGVCIAAGTWGIEPAGETPQFHAGSESYNKAEKKWVATEAEEFAGAKYGVFYGISCKSSAFCMAVGKWSPNIAAGPYKTYAATWNGTGWKLVLWSGGPPGATEGALHGVSCPAVGECEVVGEAKNSSGVEVALAYLWKEEKWTFQETPDPAGAKSSSLEAVSCTAAEVCNAVGAELNSSNVQKPFGEIL